jgi:hypothetical protein
MSHKEKVDSIFRDRSVGLSELIKVSDEVETYLDEIKEMLKKLYLLLYEAQDLIKKTIERQGKDLKLDEDMKRKKEEDQKKAEEEAQLRRKMERERIETAARATAVQPGTGAEVVPKARAASSKTLREDPTAVKNTGGAGPQPAGVPVQNPPGGAAHGQTLEVARPLPGRGAEDDDEEDGQVIATLPADFKIPEKIAGLVHFLGLGEWFKRLRPENQREVVAILISDGSMTFYDILEREIETLKPQFATYCWRSANRLMRHGYDELATGLLIKGLTVVTKKRDKEMLHIMYAKYFYRQRKMLKNAYEACVNHCEKVIRSYLQDKEERPKPVAPFKLLTMIYEEKEDLDKIMEVCDTAVKLYQGSTEESKVLGFLRIKDILAKKEKQIKEKKQEEADAQG